ncbi:MAG: type II toxin-antitoxin system PemK/MazF family toxin [Gemmatimonadales bacterium]
MKRGEVWWADLPRPVGRRPVVLVSRNEAYAVRELVTVVPVTTRARNIPVEIPLGRDEGLPRRCVANADTITTIPKGALNEYAGVLAGDKVAALDAALRFALALD